MGQRSQIYVRYNGKLIIANYYGWNYGERMISRARYGIEYLKTHIQYDWSFRDPTYLKKFSRMFDVNFDIHDVAISSDIIREHREEFPEEDFNGFVFDYQDNNDGQLFVDIQNEEIFYCFRNPYDNKIMDAEQYMEWDAEDWQQSEYISDAGKTALVENIKEIKNMAKLMTEEQLNNFLHGNYSD